MLQATLLLCALLSATPERPKLVVLDLSPAGGVTREIALDLTDSVTTEVAARGFFSVVSSKDIQTLLGMERQRQMLGCSEQSSCLTELAGAIGARFVMSGTIAKLGEAYQLSLQTLDSQKAIPVGRTSRLAKDLETLRGQIPYAVAEATGTPMPPPPSRALPFTLMGAGALVVVGGGILGMTALTREGSLRTELELGFTNQSVLKPLEVYQKEANDVGIQKTVSLAALGTGAALVALGVFLNPPETVSTTGARAWLVPSPNGMALVGIFE